MSGVYWGIVFGLLAVVATLLICIDIIYSNSKGSPRGASGTFEEPGEAATQASVGSRQACVDISDRPGGDSLFRKRRCPMVEIISFGTMAALVWLLAWSLAGESESEKRRMSSSHEGNHSAGTVAQGTRTRHAA